MEFEADINGKKLIAQCEQSLADQARWLLSIFCDIDRKRGKLMDGFQLQIGWSILSLKQIRSCLLVCEPDYTGNPFDSNVEDVTRSLLIHAQQTLLLRTLHLHPYITLFSDKIIAAKHALEAPNIYLERKDGVQSGDSGWFIGSLDNESNNTELEALFTYQLLQRRPAILQALLLPPSLFVVLNNNQLREIYNENNELIWNAKLGKN